MNFSRSLYPLVCLQLLGMLFFLPAGVQAWGPNDLEAAIAAAPDGGVIELPAGEFDFTSDWNPPNPLSKALTLRGTGQTVIKGTSAAAVNGGRFLRTEADLALEGIELRDYGEAIKLSPVAGATIEVSFENVRFVGFTLGIQASGHANDDTGFGSLIIRDCLFENGDMGVDIRMPTYQNVHIEANQFVDLEDRGINLGNSFYDPSERRAQIFVRGNTVKRVGSGSSIQPIGIIVHGSHCFLTENYIEEVNADDSGESAGIYTKCTYSKVLGNTIVDSSASAPGTFNGAITIKGKERDEDDGSQGFGALVADNHVIFNDLTRAKRVAVKVHADWAYITDNVIENATDSTVISLTTVLHHVTERDQVTWTP